MPSESSIWTTIALQVCKKFYGTNPIFLISLHLSNNRITSIKYEDVPKVNYYLLEIYLESNNLTTINFQALDREPNKTMFSGNYNLYLNDNPIICDCNLLNFVKLLKNELPFNMTKHLEVKDPNLYCAEPERLTIRGFAVQTLDSLQLECAIAKGDPGFEECPEKCHCFKRTADHSLVINCSHAGLRHVPKLPVAYALNFSYAVLYLNNNSIGELPKDTNSGFLEVREIYATGKPRADNFIREHPRSSQPSGLEREPN